MIIKLWSVRFLVFAFLVYSSSDIKDKEWRKLVRIWIIVIELTVEISITDWIGCLLLIWLETEICKHFLNLWKKLNFGLIIFPSGTGDNVIIFRTLFGTENTLSSNAQSSFVQRSIICDRNYSFKYSWFMTEKLSLFNVQCSVHLCNIVYIRIDYSE